MASTNSAIPDEQNNNNNNNNLQWQYFCCPQCQIRIATCQGHLQFEHIRYATLQPDGRTVSYFWDPYVVLNNMVNVQLTGFENRVRQVQCSRCSAFLGWKSSYTGRHYLPFGGITLYGGNRMYSAEVRFRPNRNNQSGNSTSNSSNADQ